MKLKDLEILRARIKEEYKFNDKEIEKLNLKSNILNANKLDDRVMQGIVFSIALWGIVIFGYTVGLMNSYFLSIPAYAFSWFTLGGCAAIGFVAEKLFIKKACIREGLKKFTNSESQKDIFKEDILNNIKIEKLKNDNKILDIIDNKLIEEETALKVILNKYNVEEIDNVEKKDAIVEKINENSKLFKQKKEELDNFITKCVLKNSSVIDMDRLTVLRDILLMGTMLMVLVDLPVVLMGQLNIQNLGIGSSPFEVLFAVLSPFFLGSGAVALYDFKKLNDKREVYEELREEIGEDKRLEKCLEDGYSFEYSEIFNKYYSEGKIKYLNEISEIKLELASEEVRLNNIKNEDKSTYKADYSYNRNFSMDKELEMIDVDLEEKYVGGTRIKKLVKSDEDNIN